MESEITYLLAQGELGGFEVVVGAGFKPALTPAPTTVSKRATDARAGLKPAPTMATTTQNTQNDTLWKNAANITDFYDALQKHSIYTKSGRLFFAPQETKANAAYLLLFNSPQELTEESRDILERLFKKLGIDLGSCSISFFFKCNATAMPREKSVLKDMLCKEIELINPGKLIFFREAPRADKTENPTKIDGVPITFAGKPAITLYSLLEMLPSKEDYAQKMRDTWDVHLPRSGWF
ncbi:MAG: hypothetical protein LBB36_04655 [Fibromonadaceae bacterium]|nr:hypothetical protein [Fibromonadaceae bacterium]